MKTGLKGASLLALSTLLAIAIATWAVAACGEEASVTTGTTGLTTPADTGADGVSPGSAGGVGGTGGTVAVLGLVDKPATLSVVDLANLGPETLTLDHPQNGPTEYVGVRFSAVVEASAVQPEAATVLLRAGDGYSVEVALTDIAASSVSLLVLEPDGTISTAFPGVSEEAWVKNVVSMEFK